MLEALRCSGSPPSHEPSYTHPSLMARTAAWTRLRASSHQKDLLDVGLHRVLAEVNAAGDLLVRQPLRYQTKDLLLAVVERGSCLRRAARGHTEASPIFRSS